MLVTIYQAHTVNKTKPKAKQAEVAKLWLTHYSPSLARPEDYKKEVQEIFPQTYIARDGWSEELMFAEDDAET